MLENITKREAAKQQLSSAIDLLFRGVNLIPVYSLAANAWELLSTLAQKKGIASFSQEASENIDRGGTLFRIINDGGRNFFKHADQDPDEVFEQLRPDNCDTLIMLAVMDYERMYQESPIEQQVFQLWYLTLYHHKISEAHWKRVTEFGEQQFPNLTNESRERQLALGRDAVLLAYQDECILNDPRTELLLHFGISE